MKNYTLSDAIERYVKTAFIRKPKSQIKQVQQLEWWQAQLGSYRITDITHVDIIAKRDELTKGMTPRGKPRTPATANRYVAALSHVFTVAVKEWGWLEDNPMRKVVKLREPRGRVRFLSDDERRRLLKVCKESESAYLYLIVVLALSTGARRMEILGLRWQDVDLNREVVIFQETKNGERRAVPLTGHALKLMLEHAKTSHLHCDWVFPSHNKKQPIDIRTPWETAIKRAKISSFRFHDLRHSTASYLAMNNASTLEIAEVLGHKTLAMVKRYAHLSAPHTVNIVSKMNQRIFALL